MKESVCLFFQLFYHNNSQYYPLSTLSAKVGIKIIINTTADLLFTIMSISSRDSYTYFAFATLYFVVRPIVAINSNVAFITVLRLLLHLI